MHAETAFSDPAIASTAVDSRTYAIDRAMEPLRWVFRWGSLVMLVAMVTLPFVQVIAREILGAPLIGSDELARFMLICTVFVALPYVAAGGANIRMEEILSLCPERIVRSVKIVIALVAIATFVTAAIASMVAIGSNLDNATPTLGMPYWLFLGAAFVSFSMTAVESAIQLIKLLQHKPPYISFPQELEPEEELDLPPEMKI